VPSILTRYVLRRWATPFLGALLFYGFLLLSWEMVRISKEIFSEGAPLRWLVPLPVDVHAGRTWDWFSPWRLCWAGFLEPSSSWRGPSSWRAQGLGAGRRTWTAPWCIMAFLLVVLASLKCPLHGSDCGPDAAEGPHPDGRGSQGKVPSPRSASLVPPGAPDRAFWVSPGGQIHIMESTAQGVQHLTASTHDLCSGGKAGWIL